MNNYKIEKMVLTHIFQERGVDGLINYVADEIVKLRACLGKFNMQKKQTERPSCNVNLERRFFKANPGGWHEFEWLLECLGYTTEEISNIEWVEVDIFVNKTSIEYDKRRNE